MLLQHYNMYRTLSLAVLIAALGAPAVATTTLISINRSDTTSHSGSSADAVMTPDGTFVAFTSFANDLVTGVADGNGPGSGDVFVRDVRTRTTTPVSISHVFTLTGD